MTARRRVRAGAVRHEDVVELISLDARRQARQIAGVVAQGSDLLLRQVREAAGQWRQT